MSELRAAAEYAKRGIDAAYDALEAGRVDEAMLHLGAHGAMLAAALAEQPQPVAVVTECEACFTPDVCQLRGTCDHYSAEWLRVAPPPPLPPPAAASSGWSRADWQWMVEAGRRQHRAVTGRDISIDEMWTVLEAALAAREGR